MQDGQWLSDSELVDVLLKKGFKASEAAQIVADWHIVQGIRFGEEGAKAYADLHP